MDTLRKFIRYYKPYQAVFYLDLICAAAISLVDLAYPQILRTLTRTLFTGSSQAILSALPLIGAGMFAMYVIQSLCKYYVSYQGHMMGAHMERDMRQQLFDHYEKLSFSYYDNNNSGQMMSKLVSDLFDIAEFAHHGPENLFISLIKIIGSFIFLFLINWRLAVPLMILVLFMIVFSARLQDTLAGIRVVQSFANEDVEQRKFRKSNEGFLQSKDNNYRCMGTFMGSNLFFQGMMYLVTVVYGGWLIAHGQMAVEDLAMYALYIGIFISPIQILVELAEMMQKGLSGFKRFEAMMETEPQIVDAPDAVDLTDVKGHVTYEDVSFQYNDEEEVLRHVSFDIPAGRSVALVGPSGGGKTTICSLLPRFYDVTGGRVLIDGKDVSKQGDLEKPADHDWNCSAGCIPVLRNGEGKYRLRKTWGFYGGNYRGGQKSQYPRLYYEPSRWLRHLCGRAGNQTVRRTEAADFHCQGIPEESAHSDFG